MTYQDAIRNSTFIIWQIVTYSIIAPRKILVSLDLSEISNIFINFLYQMNKDFWKLTLTLTYNMYCFFSSIWKTYNKFDDPLSSCCPGARCLLSLKCMHSPDSQTANQVHQLLCSFHSLPTEKSKQKYGLQQIQVYIALPRIYLVMGIIFIKGST